MTLEEQIALQSLGVDPSVLLATGGGLSRTDLNALLNPQQALGIGVIDPAGLEAAMRQYIEQQLAEQQAGFEQGRLEILAGVRPEPNELEYKPLTVDTIATIEAQGSGFTSEQKKLLETAMTAVALGNDPEIAALSVRESIGDLSDTAEKNLNAVLANFGTVQTEARNFNDAYRKWEVDTAVAEQEVEAFAAGQTDLDLPALRREFYQQQGVPIMGMLPDPSAEYQFDVETLLGQQGRTERLSDALTSAGRPTQQTRTFGPMANVDVPSGQFGPTDQPLSLEGKVAEKQLREYLEGQGAFSRLLGSRLAQQGRTPFQASREQLLQYGLLEANQ